MDSDSGSGSDSDSESEFRMEQEWEQLEAELHQLVILQEEIQKRMNVLQELLREKQSGQSGQSDAVFSCIRACHEESLKGLEETGEVSFGRRLLAMAAVADGC